METNNDQVWIDTRHYYYDFPTVVTTKYSKHSTPLMEWKRDEDTKVLASHLLWSFLLLETEVLITKIPHVWIITYTPQCMNRHIIDKWSYSIVTMMCMIKLVLLSLYCMFVKNCTILTQIVYILCGNYCCGELKIVIA